MLLVAAAFGSLAPSSLRAAPAQDPPTLRVVVTAEDSGAPLAGAVVTLPELGISVATDQTGAVVIPGIPSGWFSVGVSRLGYVSFASSVEVASGPTALEVALSSTPIALDPVVVEGQTAEINGALDRAGFYERRAQGLGYSFDRVEIERANPRIPSDLIRGLPGVESRQVGSSNYAIGSRRGFAGFDTLMVIDDQAMSYDCRMQVFVDGAAFGAPRPVSLSAGAPAGVRSRDGDSRLSGDDGVLDMIPIESIEAIEVLSAVSRLPAQYNVANANCGAILVWTRNFAVPTPLGARAPAGLTRAVQPGNEVRLASDLASGRFRVAAAGPGGLLLRRDPESPAIDVPAAAIAGLEVNMGRPLSHGRGLLLGGLAGTLGGIVVALRCNVPPYECFTGGSPETSALMSVGVGSLLGLAVSFARGDVWEPGRLPNGP